MPSHPLDLVYVPSAAIGRLVLDLDWALALPEIRVGTTEIWVRRLNGPLVGIPDSVETLTLVDCQGFQGLDDIPETTTTLRLVDCPDFIDLEAVRGNVKSLTVYGCPDVEYGDIVGQLEELSLDISGFEADDIRSILGVGCPEMRLYDPDLGVALMLERMDRLRELTVECVLGTIYLEIQSLPEGVERVNILGAQTVSVPETDAEVETSY